MDRRVILSGVGVFLLSLMLRFPMPESSIHSRRSDNVKGAAGDAGSPRFLTRQKGVKGLAGLFSRLRDSPLIKQGLLQEFPPLSIITELLGSTLGNAMSSRTCLKDSTYEITSGADLFNSMNELECIFARGVAPLKPPTGPWYGYPLDVLTISQAELRDALKWVWAGKLGLQSRCKGSGSDFYMVFNAVRNSFSFPAYMYIGQYADGIDSKSGNDNGQSLVVDFTRSLDDTCPDHEYRKSVSTVYPINKIVDLVRYIGKTAEGGHILLGKTLLKNTACYPQSQTSLAWWYIINYDSSAFGQVPFLGRTSTSFTYSPLQPIDFDQLMKVPECVYSELVSLVNSVVSQ